MRNIAIVTGASSGLGRIFTRQFDQGAGGPLDEIWLISRDEDALEKVAGKTVTPCRVLALDLTDPAAYDAVADELAAAEASLTDGNVLNVQWLVNCAGFGKFGTFSSIGAKGNANMIRLNCLAVVELCYRAILYMHAGSRIINLSSAAALVPQPELTVYGATKRFVLDFSRGLDFELRGTGIHVSAVCPKFMHTAFLERPGNRSSVASMTWIGFEDADHCAKVAIAKSLMGHTTIFTSPDVALMNGLCKVLPCRLVMGIEHAIGSHQAALAEKAAQVTSPRP